MHIKQLLLNRWSGACVILMKQMVHVADNSSMNLWQCLFQKVAHRVLALQSFHKEGRCWISPVPHQSSSPWHDKLNCRMPFHPCNISNHANLKIRLRSISIIWNVYWFFYVFLFCFQNTLIFKVPVSVPKKLSRV